MRVRTWFVSMACVVGGSASVAWLLSLILLPLRRHRLAM